MALSSQSWKLIYRWFSDDTGLFLGLSDCTGWKLKVQCRSTRAQCHTRMSVQWITEQRSIKSASETLHTCGSCNVTTPSMCKEQWALCGNLNTLCLKILDILSNKLKPIWVLLQCHYIIFLAIKVFILSQFLLLQCK